MNVKDVLDDSVTALASDKVYSSILFNLVNLPYKANSLDINSIIIDGMEFKYYENHYRFDSGEMIIIKIASNEFIPYGIYARKIINFLIAEFTYKKNLPHIYHGNLNRLVKLGKKPVDFIEKIAGTRKVGSNTRNSIFQQLQAVLNCRMAIATGYKQIRPDDDEVLAQDRYQFALIESPSEQLVNHKFNVYEDWQEEIFISADLAKILSSKIIPLDKAIYDQITSPMELDLFHYFQYQGFINLKKGVNEVDYTWDELFKLFGRGYASGSKGLSNFRIDFRKSLNELQGKVCLQIIAPLDSKYITFKPDPAIMISNKSISKKRWAEVEHESYKPLLEDLTTLQSTAVDNHKVILWDEFFSSNNLSSRFDKSAVKVIKRFFELDIEFTMKTIEYVLSVTPRNPSAYVTEALNNDWVKKSDAFFSRINDFRKKSATMSKKLVLAARKNASTAHEILKRRYLQEDFDPNILEIIYLKLDTLENRSEIIKWLDGSKYQAIFYQNEQLWRNDELLIL